MIFIKADYWDLLKFRLTNHECVFSPISINNIDLTYAFLLPGHSHEQDICLRHANLQ